MVDIGDINLLYPKNIFQECTNLTQYRGYRLSISQLMELDINFLSLNNCET